MIRHFTIDINAFIFVFWVFGFYLIPYINAYAQDTPFPIPEFTPPTFPDNFFSIVDYGAIQAESNINTDAFQKAIAACQEAGGGTVVVPKGIWLTGPIHLKSNIQLYLEKGAEILFSQQFEDYLPVVLIQRGGIFCYNYSPPIYAKDAQNIAIVGEGTLNGQGQAWWPWKDKQPGMVELFNMGKQGVPLENRVFGTVEAGVRPPFIQFINCKNVLLEDITVKDGPSWNIHPVFCENMIIRGVTVIAHGPNNDGIDLDACKNVLVENCITDVGDDNYCLKSGRDQEAWKYNKPCENIVIRNCVAKAGHGGFVIGSEMSAGIRNVFVYNCQFEGTSRGIRMKSRLGRGGVIENIYIQDIKMKKITNEAIILNLHYDGEPIERDMNYQEMESRFPPVFKNIHIENITCTDAGSAMRLIGLPGKYLKDIKMKNLNITAKTGIYCEDAHQVSFQEIQTNIASSPLAKIHNSKNIQINGFQQEANVDVFLEVTGKGSEHITIENIEVNVGNELVMLGDGVGKDVVKAHKNK